MINRSSVSDIILNCDPAAARNRCRAAGLIATPAATLPHCRALASVRGAEASTFENGAGAGG